METEPVHQGAPTYIASVRLLVWLLLFVTIHVKAQTIVAYQSDWKYLQNGVVQSNTGWAQPGFSDASWSSGNAPFGFGSNSGYSYNTTLQKINSSTGNNHPVYYFRKTFQVSNAVSYAGIRLRATLDDGMVIYIGGVEVARKNMTPTHSGYAGNPVGNPLLTIDTVLSASKIQNGNNVIAVELHQTGETSSDVYFDVQLEGQSASLFRYPYLQLPSHNRMTVFWYTNIATNAVVRYSTNPDLEIYKEVTSALNDTLHDVSLLNLTPDTRYYYSVGYYTGSEYRQLQYNPAVNYFRTLHDPKVDTTRAVRFWLLGDSGAGTYKNPRPYKVRDAYLAYLNAKNNPKVDGIIFLGDNSNTSPYEGLQMALDTTLFKFYNNPKDKQLLSYIPSWTVIGNHDYGPDVNYVNKAGTTLMIRKAYHKQTSASFSAFAFPENGQIGGEPTNNKKGYYSFDQGNVHFVVLNPPVLESTNVNENWERKFQSTGYYDLYSKNSIALDDSTNSPIDDLPQVKWMIKDLTNNKKKWTVVTFHLPPFSTIGHFPTEYDMKRVQEKLLPILEKPEYHVDALIVSHSHAYERAGMIRKKGTQPRTTDFSSVGNLGRYPASKPYVKTNSETAYAYVLSGSAGRGWYNVNNTSENDAGFPPGATNVKHPSTSVPPLDNLTGDNTTDFYHIKGGSVELVFQENRLDVKFIKESDVSPLYTVADSFVVMKDVSKKKTVSIVNGGDVAKLTASWIGAYNWYSAQQPSTVLASGIRDLSIGPGSTSTFYVRDQNGYLADTFIVNVTNPKPIPTGDTVIYFRSQWLFPLTPGALSRGIQLDKQCVAPWSFTAPPFEMPAQAIIGLGHTDETYRLPNALIEKVLLPVEKLWFRRSFILNGSTQTYASFKLTLLRDKNLASRKSYSTILQFILINGKAVEITATATKDVANGREEVTYTLSNKGFVYGVNYILVSYYIQPLGGMVYPIVAANDPFTFDGQLISIPSGIAPPPAGTRFLLKTVTAGTQACAGDSLPVQFTAAGNESGFPIVYEARLVTGSGDIPVGEGTTSPIFAKLPADLKKGKYMIKLATKNAFMDDFNGPDIEINELPGATIPATEQVTVWKGEAVTFPVSFTGMAPWQYVLSDGTNGSSATADTVIQMKADSSGLYALSTVRNVCGVGKVTGSKAVTAKEPFISIGSLSWLSTAPLKTALCNGDSILVNYSIIGPDKQRTYGAEISDAQGSFTNALSLGNGAANPLIVRLPTTLGEGDQYRIRIKAVNPDVDFTLSPSEPIMTRQTAKAEFTLSKAIVFQGEEIKLSLALNGTRPVYYYLRYGTDTLRGSTSEPMIERLLNLQQTTAFSLDSVRNVCGYGAVDGTRTVTVSLVLGVDPLSGQGIVAYPNPVSKTLVLKNKQQWTDTVSWGVFGTNGKLMRKGTITPVPTNSLEIDIRTLPTGLYVLKIDQGKQQNSWKIVKN
ncbi:MAG: T9SS type A sorting domain-containing protein [Dyadobacter sp.]|uniref:T9SS type A sorting domain-containing protein n=1 Tax=Dyadobacter sp. TaxID=1914288 RepID=UPI0032674B70